MGIDHRGPHVAVAQNGLDSADVVVGLKEVGGEGVTEDMGRDALGELGATYRLVQGQLYMSLMNMIPPQFPGFFDESERFSSASK
jgi:hypothetical protein